MDPENKLKSLVFEIMRCILLNDQFGSKTFRNGIKFLDNHEKRRQFFALFASKKSAVKLSIAKDSI